MGIGYYPYLFDHIGFNKILSPLVPQLKRGNYQPLFGLAKEVLDGRPELWDTLYEINLGHSFTEEAEELDPSSLLTKVMVGYLEAIDLEDQSAWRMLKPTLPLVGWTESETNLLLHGKQLCSLLDPGEEYPLPLTLTGEAYVQVNLVWCRGYVGWLDIESITLLLNHLRHSKPDFYSLAQHPSNQIQKEFDYVVDASPKWLTKRLLNSYEYTEQVFTIAYEAKKSLALAIA